MKSSLPVLKMALSVIVASGLGLAPVAADPVAVLRLSAEAAMPFDTAARLPQAPYGDKMPGIVVNYLRAAPYIGTGGLVAEGAYPLLKEVGFKTVVSLLTDAEGATREVEAAKAAGIVYISMPVAGRAPSLQQVAQFTRIVSDSANYPILVHCESGNRVGAMWALYRASLGVPGEIALQEGRTIGLKSGREGTVREMLGLPAVN